LLTLVAVVLLGVALSLAIRASDPVSTAGEGILGWFADLRTPALTGPAKAIHALTTFTAILAVRGVAVVILIVYRRFRHLVVFLLTLVVTDWVVARALFVKLPSPDVTPLIPTEVYSFPSKPVSALAITLFTAAFSVFPRGQPRRLARWTFGIALALVILSGLYLATWYPVGALYAAILAPAVAGAAFRWMVPESGFPVSYRRGGTAAHLDLTGERGDAVVRAMADQVGLVVTKVEPFGLEGSGGSSPLRMTLEDGTRVFGKIYSTGHVRADRWYRIGRTLLYGQLEDETPMGSVRRLATYEDYALRFLRDNGVPVAKTYGVVELTPNAEYMLVTEFFEGSKNLGDSDIDDVVIDEGMRMVRTFWDVGVAHRDIKPANLLVRGGHLQLVDVSGLEVRPSPWRQAVDLANMMMTLGLRSEPDRVYDRATQLFSPDEIAEAFAASMGMTIPTELQAKLKADGRPIMDRFRELAPHRDPISIQRWSGRRLVASALALVGVLVLVGLSLDSLRAGLT
jgi:tRNA A-37 threonylcarbamoyl transferase component Bud32